MPSELPGRVAAKLLRHRAGTAAFCTLTYKLETLYKVMQILFRAFLAIYLAHLLTDFVFQTHRLVEQKRRGPRFCCRSISSLSERGSRRLAARAGLAFCWRDRVARHGAGGPE